MEFNLSGPVLFQQLMKRHGDSNWFYGARQLYREVHLRYAGSRQIGRVPPAAVDLVASYIEQDITTSGLGLVLEYDSRDNPLGPTQGYNYVAHFTRFDDALGSDVEYSALHLQGLNYWGLSARWDLALRVQYDSASGDRELALLAQRYNIALPQHLSHLPSLPEERTEEEKASMAQAYEAEQAAAAAADSEPPSDDGEGEGGEEGGDDQPEAAAEDDAEAAAEEEKGIPLRMLEKVLAAAAAASRRRRSDAVSDPPPLDHDLSVSDNNRRAPASLADTAGCRASAAAP